MQISDRNNYNQIKFIIKFHNPQSQIRNRIAPLLHGKIPKAIVASALMLIQDGLHVHIQRRRPTGMNEEYIFLLVKISPAHKIN